MQINLPEALAGMGAAFDRYERALIENDPATLENLFWNSQYTLRYGIAENLYGWKEICDYRRTRASAGGAPNRRITRKVLTTYGPNFGTVNIEYVRDNGNTGRQSQTWMRTPEGWRVVAAHVSMMQASDEAGSNQPKS